MSPGERPASAPRSKAALLVVGDFRANVGYWPVLSVHDESGQFLGEFTGDHSGFATTLEPGNHTIHVRNLRGDGPNTCHTFTGEFAAGKVYVALFLQKHIHEVAPGEPTLRWLFPRPRSKLLDAGAVWHSAPFYRADLRAGQRLLETSRGPSACSTPGETVMPEDAAFDTLP